MDIKGIQNNYQIHFAALRGKMSQKTEQTPQAQKSRSDSIDISPAGALQSKVESAAVTYTAIAKENASVSAARIAALKIKYQGDASPVSGMDIAQSILEKVCGDRSYARLSAEEAE